MTKTEQSAEALNRAVTNQTMTNYPAIFQGFIDKGIPEDEILPRENVFTFNAWRALGRTVKKGEHGVKVVTWIPMTKKDPETGEVQQIGKKARTVTVFHVSQTTELAPV